MEFIDDILLGYCENHSAEEPALLRELNRETHLRVQSPRMLSGHLQGRLLSFLSKMISPRNILEIGTYTGYSALCLAEGLAEGGRLVTIDPNEETNSFARTYFDRSAYRDKITLMEGSADKIIPGLDISWDLVFIDADKKSYCRYFDLVVERVRPGGLIIADNVLWSGKVLKPATDQDTKAIVEFNERVAADARVESLMLPVRDGLTLVRKL